MDNDNTNTNEQGFNTAYSPLDENVVKRDYTAPKVQIEDISPIDEPIIAIPSFDELDNNFKNQLGDDDPSGSADPRKVWGSETETSTANPYTENLDKKEQKMAAKAMVDAVLDGYGSLKKWSNNLIKIDPKKVKKAINDGLIDGNIAIPVGSGEHVPLMQYVEMYNTETADVIGMSDEFREKVSPVLLRVFMKRGIGMTDEQLLAYYFGMDILTTGAQIFALRKQNNEILAQLKEMTENTAGMRSATSAQAAEATANVRPNDPIAPTPEPTPTTPPPPPPSNEREYIEPEEVVQPNTRREEFTNFEVIDDLQPEAKPRRTAAKKSRIVKSNAIPQFGTDNDILNHMEQLAKSESKKAGRKGRQSKN
jgi:hypothetical protein